jgi:putative peptidoglycan lipid II flippase
MSPDAAPVPTKPAPGLLRSSFIVSLMTMLSRVLGLLRDIAFGVFIGAGGAADPFFIAFRIPNFLRRLFAEGAFSQAFVPVLSEYREQRSFEEVRALVDRVSGVLGLSLIAVSSFAVIAAPLVTFVFAPGFADMPEKFALTSNLLRITFPYLFLISMTGFAGAVLNAYGRFGAPAFAPVLLNVCLIAAAFIATRYFEEPTYALAWGVLVAGVAQWVFQMPFLARIHLLPRPRWDPKHEGVKRVLSLMVPALFGVSVYQVNLLLDTIIASFLPVGSVSWLYYSDRLSELPLGMFAIAIATVILPALSRNRAAVSLEKFSITLDWALRMILLTAVPASVALFVLGHSILIALFQHGETTPRDALMSSYALMAVATGLTAFMLIKVLAPGYYSRQDMRTPVRVGIIAMVANMVFNLILVPLLHMKYQLGHVGLALATSLSAWLNAGLLAKGLLRKDVFTPQPGWLGFFAKLLLAAGTMGLVLWVCDPAAAVWQAWAWWQRLGVLAAICGVGMAVYVGLMAAFGLRMRHVSGPAA